ncbi:MAG: cytidylyltransferase domain-containing protein [Spirochaetota bacterium]
MTGVLLQARLSSTRMPNKALLELGGRTVVEQAMRSLSRVPAHAHVLVTDEESSLLLAPRAHACGWEHFAGSRENVLDRFVSASRRFGLTEIVRATGDNPLVSWELARMAVAARRRLAADYLGFDGPPLGTGVEVVLADALERAHRESYDPYDREHVTPYLYRNPGRFACSRVAAPPAYRLPAARVSLDTAEDYAALCELFGELYEGDPIPVLRLIRHLGARRISGEGNYVHDARP